MDIALHQLQYSSWYVCHKPCPDIWRSLCRGAAPHHKEHMTSITIWGLSCTPFLIFIQIVGIFSCIWLEDKTQVCCCQKHTPRTLADCWPSWCLIWFATASTSPPPEKLVQHLYSCARCLKACSDEMNSYCTASVLSMERQKTMPLPLRFLQCLLTPWHEVPKLPDCNATASCARSFWACPTYWLARVVKVMILKLVKISFCLSMLTDKDCAGWNVVWKRIERKERKSAQAVKILPTSTSIWVVVYARVIVDEREGTWGIYLGLFWGILCAKLLWGPTAASINFGQGIFNVCSMFSHYETWGVFDILTIPHTFLLWFSLWISKVSTACSCSGRTHTGLDGVVDWKALPCMLPPKGLGCCLPGVHLAMLL